MSKVLSTIKNEKVLHIIQILVISFFICFAILALLDYETVFTQTELDVYFSKAIFAISFMILVLKKVKPFNWQSVVAAIVLFALYCFYITPLREASNIVIAGRYSVLAYWFVLLVVVDSILHKKSFLEQCRRVPLILYVSMAFFVNYYRMSRKEMLILAIPMLLFFTIQLEKRQWKQFLLSVYYGCFASFCITIWKSLEFAGISGSNRWYGYFPTLATFGLFLSCCFTLSLWGFWYVLLEKKTCKTPLFFFNCVWMVAILYFGLVAVGTRTFCLVILGEFVALTCLFWNKIPKKFKIGALIILFFGVLAVTVLIIYLQSFSEAEIEQLIGVIIEKYGENGITYSIRTFLRFFLPHFQVNEQFSGFWSLVDFVTGNRLTIAKTYLEQVSFTPNGSVSIFILPYSGHAHNTYIQMAYQFGIPTAIFYIGFFVYGLVNRVRAYKRNHETYNLLSILWIVMMFSAWITETVIVCSVMTIIGLITMYPFVVNLDD